MVRLRRLHQSRHRQAEQCLLLEGSNLVLEALALGLHPERILATEAWIASHRSLLERAAAGASSGLTLQPVSVPVLETVATTVSPDGVVAVLRAESLPAEPAAPDFVLVLDRLQDPGNLGTLMRLARAAQVQALWLLGGADPWQPKVLRASAGAALHLPARRFAATGELQQALAGSIAAGLQIVGTLPPGAEPAPRPYWELDWRRPTVLLLGNEGSGLDPALLAALEQRVTVPHDPSVESLNVAIAAAPLLLERQRQRLQVTMTPAMQQSG
ncbi:RNA methyltransferase [Synechococcus sp. RSCCF101]|uniref:TrmH family RNA methyltransferase n=1 Tax=Synechococcus sp. RSCCF101 TaxID=2511069 RepID=UPI001CD919BB|nr:RNA methyltransferase [Synechococcus sp. RSCCF101]